MQIIVIYSDKANKNRINNADNLIYTELFVKMIPQNDQIRYNVNMAKTEYSKYQKDIISKYYDNLDSLMLQKLQELVTDLYLAETQAKQKQLWKRAHKAMQKLKIHPEIIEHIMEKQNVEILAKNLQGWLNKKWG